MLNQYAPDNEIKTREEKKILCGYSSFVHLYAILIVQRKFIVSVFFVRKMEYKEEEKNRHLFKCANSRAVGSFFFFDTNRGIAQVIALKNWNSNGQHFMGVLWLTRNSGNWEGKKKPKKEYTLSIYTHKSRQTIVLHENPLSIKSDLWPFICA